ncbi:MAG TPA: hypothetical protein VHF45_06705 [Thermoleophilaceae bacterium]|nr:hypothetical protein [Thermoleophilaceae bacterium]
MTGGYPGPPPGAPGGGWGPPTPTGGGGPPTPVGDKNTIAFVSFLLSASGAAVLYIFVVLAPVSLALGVAGTICAWIARQRIKRGETNADPMWADVGLAVGGVCTGVSLIVFVVIAVAFITG